MNSTNFHGIDLGGPFFMHDAFMTSTDRKGTKERNESDLTSMFHEDQISIFDYFSCGLAVLLARKPPDLGIDLSTARLSATKCNLHAEIEYGPTV